MPFTAFHMGAALFGKGLAPKSQSLIFFGACTAAIDLEPAIKMAIGSTADLHQITHHPIGLAATVAACAILWRWAQGQSWWGKGMPVLGWKALIDTALWAALSHWLLDAMSHVDMSPVIAGYFGIEAAQNFCIALGVLGLVLLGLRYGLSASVKALRQLLSARPR